MAWWFEGATSIISNFFIFFESRNKRKKQIFGEISGKYRKFREKSMIFSRFFFFRFFPMQIFSKPAEKSDFLFPAIDMMTKSLPKAKFMHCSNFVRLG